MEITDLIGLHDLSFSVEKPNDAAFVSYRAKDSRKSWSSPDIVFDNVEKVMKYESGNEGM